MTFGDEVRRSRRSVFFGLDVTPDASARNLGQEQYPHMLMEDVANHIMPIGGQSEREGFSVRLEPVDAAATQVLAAAVEPGRYGYGALTGALCEFVKEMAHTLMAFEEANYEIVTLTDSDTETVIGFELALIPPGSLRHRFGRKEQLVPQSVAEGWGLNRVIELPAQTVVTFRLPHQVRQGWKGMMKALAHLSDHQLPNFVIGSSQSVHYDGRLHRRTRSMALAAATNLIGWNLRDLLEDETLEYYTLDRHLTFEQFVIDFREHILATLNQSLKRVGPGWVFPGTLLVEGLPGREDIEEARRLLREGAKPFSEIFATFLQI